MSDELFLIAHLAGRGVAIAAAHVGSVVDIGAVVPAPGAAPGVVGLAALRSRVVTVIDPGVALGEPARKASAARRGVIVAVDGQHYALLVDALEDVAPFAVKPVPGGLNLKGGWAAAARGVVERDGEPLLVVDCTAFIPGLAPAIAA